MSKWQQDQPSKRNRSVRKGASQYSHDECLLSLEKCRKLLPSDCNLSDAELETLRNSLHCLAAVAVDMSAERKAMGRMKHSVQQESRPGSHFSQPKRKDARALAS